MKTNALFKISIELEKFAVWKNLHSIVIRNNAGNITTNERGGKIVVSTKHYKEACFFVKREEKIRHDQRGLSSKL